MEALEDILSGQRIKKVKFRRILSFGIFYICIVFRFILPRFGMLMQEKSGKPDSESQ
jgi:hypothetical protein